MKTIDLRSDTVTKPTEEMRKAMAEAEVGDDVYGEDPTVNRLQEMAADRLGREAALFVPSGCMGNQVSIWVHTEPGDEIIVEGESHILNYEMGAMAAMSSVMPRPVRTGKGILSVQDIKGAIHPDVYYYSKTSMIALENSHNEQGGRIYPLSVTREVLEFAHNNGIAVHLDGARIFNSAVASGRSPAELAAGFDSIMFCLSKGLGAPVGSMVVGNSDFIEAAHRARKRFGGGMRQVGVLAAAGIYALENNVDRLKQDHENARRLGEGLTKLGFEVIPHPPETNIIYVHTEPLDISAPRLAGELSGEGIKITPHDETSTRLVTHLGISAEDIEYVLEKVGDILPVS